MVTTSRFRADEHPRDLTGRFTSKARPESPNSDLGSLIGRSRVDEWVAEAFTRTVVEKIDSPPGLLADCVVAPGGITVGRSEQEARDEMRSALTDWADLRVARGYDLPELASRAAAP